MSKKYIERYWRKATKEDSIKDPMMDARFRAAVKSDQEYGEDPAKDLVMDAMFRATAAGCDWVYGKLYGWDRETNLWSSEENCGWDEAEVYDAPDPGEGYELVDPTIEKPGPGIEYRFGIYWHSVSETAPLDVNTTYRRKVVQSPTLAGDATPSACKRIVAVRANVDGKDVLVRPLLQSEEVTSADIFLNEKGQPERAYTAVGQLQSNADHPYYREVRPQPEAEPKAAATKPEAAEPVTFVAHPIQFNDKGECLFYGKVIQERSYAVLNEHGHYLMWRLGVGPVYVPEFRQAFTPTQLQQVSVRELGSNIRLRAVEPVDVDKLKQEYMQELKEKLAPKAPAWEPKRQKVLWKGREYYVLSRFHCVTEHGHCPKERVVLQDPKARDGFLSMAFADDLEKIPSEPQPEAPHPVKEPKYVPFTWDDCDELRERWIEHIEKQIKYSCDAFSSRPDNPSFLYVRGIPAEDLVKYWRFIDTKEPVGKRVED